MDGEKLIFAIGNPLLDISAECDVEVLEKYGLTNGLACLAEEKHKALFEELWKNEHVETIPGGAAMNAIRSAHFMLKGEYPHSCMYFGSIADDERGEILRKALEKEHIEHNFSHAEDTYTGACAVVINNKERALCADLAACLKYKSEHLEENIETLKNYKILYSTGYFMTSNLNALKRVAQFATDNNKIFAFNLSAVFLISIFKDDYIEVLSHADIVFGNEDEVDAFGAHHGLTGGSRQEIVDFIAKLPKKKTNRPRVVIGHQGPHPAATAIYNPETEELVSKEHEFDVLPASEIVDLNSAGDSFAGGYLAATALGYDHEVAMKAAFYCARYIIQESGCSFTHPNEFEYPALE